MNTRRWLGLILVVLAVMWMGESPSRAQHVRSQGRQKQVREGDNSRFQESHRPINTDLADNVKPEDLLAMRLAGSRKLLNGDELPQEFLELAKSLMDNEKLRESLKKHLSPDDLERLREQLANGESISDPKSFQKLIESSKDNPTLSPEMQERLKRWAEEIKAKDGHEAHREWRGKQRPAIGYAAERMARGLPHSAEQERLSGRSNLERPSGEFGQVVSRGHGKNARSQVG